MRVLLVNTSEHTGGAAIAASRLMKALHSQGVEAEMLVNKRESENTKVHAIPGKVLQKIRFVAERLGIVWANRGSRKNLFAIDPATHGADITRLPQFQQADIVHLHWFNQGMLSLGDVEKILQSGKPVVWTMHDMWPVTGVCHQAGACERWLTGCGHCPLLRGGGGAEDLSVKTYERKRKTYGSAPMTFVACSDWLAEIARRAPLLKGCPVHSIPNPIDTEFFVSQDKVKARQALGLPLDKKILLFVAYKATDPNKGIQYLRQALEQLHESDGAWTEQLAVVPVGREASTLQGTFPCALYPQEYVSSEETMRMLYDAADVLLMPTLMDNLPNTVVEAMACSTPCVAFNVGGLPQMITPGVDGYLARYKDASDLAQGIRAVLSSANYPEMATAAREKAVNTYSEAAVAQRFIALYENLLSPAKEEEK